MMRRIVPLSVLMAAAAVAAVPEVRAAAGEAVAAAPLLATVHVRPWAPPLLLAVFALLIFLPFLPGLVEVYRPRDRYPLPINTAYAKDPRFLGLSARKVFHAAVANAPEGEGPHLLWLSHEEQVVVSGPRTVKEDTAIDHVFYVRGDLGIERRCAFAKDVYASGAVSVGEQASLRTLAADGDMDLGPHVAIGRWVDSEGDLTVGERVDLGHSASCAGRLRLGDAVTFTRLYGREITTPGVGGEGAGPVGLEAEGERSMLKIDPDREIKSIRDVLEYHRGNLEIGAGARVDGPLLVRGDLICGRGAGITGPVRVHGQVTLAEDAVVRGDVFAEGAVRIGRNAAVTGNVFSQDHVEIESGARLGRPGADKTVIGKRSITLAEGVRLHGYVLTDGRGKVLCGKSC